MVKINHGLFVVYKNRGVSPICPAWERRRLAGSYSALQTLIANNHAATTIWLIPESSVYQRRAGGTPAFPGRKLQKQKPVAMVLSAKSMRH
jgi:hypothetical protein